MTLSLCNHLTIKLHEKYNIFMNKEFIFFNKTVIKQLDLGSEEFLMLVTYYFKIM